MRGLGRLRKAVSRVRRSLAPAAVILTYHRVADVVADPHLITVSPDHLAQHLAYIQDTCRPMHLLDLVRAARARALPRRAVALTFDDGCVDLIEQAYPLLLEANVPATVFVTSGYVDSARCFWWDELDRLLLSEHELPHWLRLCIGGQDRAWPTASLEMRRLAHQALSRLIAPLSDREQLDVLASIRSWSGMGEAGCNAHRVMNSGELLRLAHGGLVDLGAHTVSHPVLASLSREEQEAEIATSRRQLEAIIGRPVLAFAYPHGTVDDLTAETVGLVEAAGFAVACTAIPGCVQAGAHPLRLPRFWVGNWDADEFKRHLEYYFLV